MSTIRPFAVEDGAAVAALFQETFLDRRVAAPAGLAAYMRTLYLDRGEGWGDIPSLVHVDGDGEITGFMGVDTLAMRYGDKVLRAAISGSLMVRDHAGDPMAGARLLKALLDGPQDISLSETASEVAMRMWTSLRGVALAQYSLDWLRVLRPGSFAVEAAARKFKPSRLLAPLGRGFDRLAGLAMKEKAEHWIGLREARPAPGGLAVREIDAAAFAALVEPLTRQFSLRPQWEAGQLDAIIAEAREKPSRGDLVLCAVETRAGAPVGAFAYHVRRGHIARVLQILARPGQAGPVLDCLVGDAFRRGAAALRGRTQPALLEAMQGRRIAFVNVGSTVVHSRDPALVAACRAGELFFNGLAGEQWNRMIGGSFD